MVALDNFYTSEFVGKNFEVLKNLIRDETAIHNPDRTLDFCSLGWTSFYLNNLVLFFLLYLESQGSYKKDNNITG